MRRRVASLLLVSTACHSAPARVEPAAAAPARAAASVTVTDTTRVAVPVRSVPSSAFVAPDSLERFRLVYAAPEGEGSCRWSKTQSGDDLLMVRYPSEQDPTAMASIVIDSAGRVVRYSERRGGVVIPGVPGASPQEQVRHIQAEEAKIRRSSIHIEFLHDFGMVRNEGGGLPLQVATTRASTMAGSAAMGRPQARITAMLARCGSPPR